MDSTIYQRLQDVAEKVPANVAFSSLYKRDASYKDLAVSVDTAIKTLTLGGVRLEKRVAVVLDKRFAPELGVLFLAISSCATYVPIDADSDVDNIKDQLTRLDVSFIVNDVADHRFDQFCRENDIKQFKVKPLEGEISGELIFDSINEGIDDVSVTFASTDDVAIVLQTSGTTSTPKTMPLRHRNLVAVADSFVDSLELTGDDVCLNVMPMFHYHGLIVAMLSTVFSGGTTACIGYYNKSRFIEWFKYYRPTWYTAVSGIHQDILSLQSSLEDIKQNSRLRFIRSSSNALLPKVLTGLENIFDVPLVESYGVSEAGTLACNPVDRKLRKIGSVGKTVPGIELYIADVNGHELGCDQIGEIVAKGPAMIDGYEEENRNADSFKNGWFFTGDLGYVDSDGYLHVKGRVKELIRKGKEAIVPFEIDMVLNEYQKVAEGVAFSIDSLEFGEDIAAVVVPKSGESLTEEEIVSHLQQHLPSRHIPKLVLIRESIPKNAIGKPLRIGMSNHLGLPD